MRTKQANSILLAILGIAAPAEAARLSLAYGGAGAAIGLPPDVLRMDVVWTMRPLDRAMHKLTSLAMRFDVAYPLGGGFLEVVEVSTLPVWNLEAAQGIGGPFTEAFFLAAGDVVGASGIVGNGSEFSTVAASVFLRATGNVADTAVTFRVGPALPDATNGASMWLRSWQHPLDAGGTYDIGVGNPGDDDPYWNPYHGFEVYQPLLLVPEPGPVALMALSALALFRFKR